MREMEVIVDGCTRCFNSLSVFLPAWLRESDPSVDPVAPYRLAYPVAARCMYAKGMTQKEKSAGGDSEPEMVFLANHIAGERRAQKGREGGMPRALRWGFGLGWAAHCEPWCAQACGGEELG
jgi:hypothetical protein